MVGSRLGDPDPRQEGPADLRLVPPALAVWGAAALAVGLPGVWAAVATAGALVSAAALWAWRSRVWCLVAMTVLCCAAAGAASGGLHAADVRRGPVPEIAQRYGRAEVEVILSTDPRPVRRKVTGDHLAPEQLMFDADVIRVSSRAGPVTEVRTPVLVFVDPDEHLGAWRRLLPSTRLRFAGRLAPPFEDDPGHAALLWPVSKGPPPVVTGRPSWAQRTAGALRAGLRRATDPLPADARALLPGLVVGDTSRVPPELDAAFRATDLAHLTAVSGGNLNVILALLIGPPALALRAERRGLAARLGVPLRATAALGGGLTVAFVVVCRPEPSVLRAAACGLVTLLALATGRRRSLIPALAAAVLGLVLYDPWLARSYGFTLSVLATGALLTVGPRWCAALVRRGVPVRLAEVLAAAGAAQAVCAPVVAVFAARVGLVAVPCNLAAELAVAPATVLGFAALAAAPVAMPAAEVLARCAGWPAGWIAGVARAGAALPGAELTWPGGWPGGALLALVTVFVLLAARGLGRRPWTAAGCAVLLLLALLRPPSMARFMTGWPPPGWSYAMCDVGQGDATVLAAGPGSAVVVDAGPDPALVDGCLRQLGVTRVPLLLLTHFHADHVTGLPGVLRGRSVGEIETTTFAEPAGEAAFVRRTAAAAGVPVVRVTPGERRTTGPLTWRVLWPRAGPGPVTGEPNDSSVTLYVTVDHGPTLLLPGDLEPAAQRSLLRGGPPVPAVDILKVAHHGSAYQDARLLRVLRPRLALISCGKGNPYGHPSPTTVGLLRAWGAVVLRTDKDGDIAVTGSGSGLRAVSRLADRSSP
ncbi:ComEC/Rec2 family competence protein [Streptomyces sp. 8L]|uniref:ComEC/Rec2 family competence protein n=1 Tax=Streptomyces sp. 8L TaxID=2877242 RepID=UPI001CD5A8D5|nr:ComEC/Rec2 family competence protein [Streptomyces sp. 8L]MCA1217667.1 ComEC/Rec2 family competence protein [Streptomyces sp. 8L]